MKKIDQFDVEHYLVHDNFEKELSKSYFRMLKSEEQWLAEIEENGCGVVNMCSIAPLSPKRRFVVFVPPGVNLTGREYNKMLETRGVYAATAQRLAKEQGKANSVASQSAATPTWINGSNIERRPNFEISKTTYRIQKAYKGKVRGIEGVKPAIEEKIELLNNYIGNAESNSQYARSASSRAKLMLEVEKLRTLEVFLEENKRYVADFLVKFCSGRSLKINAQGKDSDDNKIAHTSSISSVVLVPVASNNYVIDHAHYRKNRKIQYEFLGSIGNFEIYLPIDVFKQANDLVTFEDVEKMVNRYDDDEQTLISFDPGFAHIFEKPFPR